MPRFSKLVIFVVMDDNDETKLHNPLLYPLHMCAMVTIVTVEGRSVLFVTTDIPQYG